MNTLLFGITMVAAVNPSRARLGFPEEGDGGTDAGATAFGGLVAVVVLGLLAAVSGPFLDAIEVTQEMFIIAAGFVALLGAARVFFRPEPVAEPRLDGWRAGLWPIAYPTLLLPEAMMLAVAFGARRGAAPVVVAGAVAVAVAWAFGRVPLGTTGRRLLAGIGAVLAAVLVVAATWLIIEGVRDV